MVATGLVTAMGQREGRMWTATDLGRAELVRLGGAAPDGADRPVVPLAEALARRIDPSAFGVGEVDLGDEAMVRALTAASRVLPVLLDLEADPAVVARALARAPADMAAMFSDDPGRPAPGPSRAASERG